MFGLFGPNLEKVASDIDLLMTTLASKYLGAELSFVYRDADATYERAYNHGDNIEIVIAGMRDFSIRVHHESYDEDGENSISFATGLNSAYQGLLLQVTSSGLRLATIQNNPVIRVSGRAIKLENILTSKYGFSNPLAKFPNLY